MTLRESKAIRLWNVETGEQLQSLNGHDSGVHSVSFSPDGKTVVSSGRDTTIKLWNVETGALLQSISGHRSTVTSVSFSPDGTMVVSSSGDNTIKLWNLDLLTVAALTTRGCDWVRNHLIYNPNDIDKEEQERAQSLCDISTEVHPEFWIYSWSHSKFCHIMPPFSEKNCRLRPNHHNVVKVIR